MTIVSVIIPTYNGGKTIERALQSVFGQEGYGEVFDLDVIVVDDCSIDNTTAICFGNDNYPLRFFSTMVNSGGPNKGRNHGIKMAVGDVITFLDQDDEWLPGKTLKQLAEINSGYEFIYSPSIKIVETGC